MVDVISLLCTLFAALKGRRGEILDSSFACIAAQVRFLGSFNFFAGWRWHSGCRQQATCFDWQASLRIPRPYLKTTIGLCSDTPRNLLSTTSLTTNLFTKRKIKYKYCTLIVKPSTVLWSVLITAWVASASFSYSTYAKPCKCICG